MRQPVAVIALPNNIEIDARAQRNALALVAAGYQVTMVGFGTGLPPQGSIVGIPYILCQPPAAAAAAAATAKGQPGLVFRATRKAFHLTLHRRPPMKVQNIANRIDETAAAGWRSLRRAVAERRPQPAPVVTDPNAPVEWRTALPQVDRMTAAMRDVIVDLQPDVIMVDVHLLPLATEVVDRLATRGHHVGVVYDAREYVYGLASEDRNITEGFPNLEQEFMPRVDATFTVCTPIARFLAEKYQLATEPPIVPNAPIGELPPVERTMTIRDFLDVPVDAPLLAYAGGLSHHRGVHDVIAALPELPGVHFAIGARRPSSYTLELEQQAARLGVADRVHFVPFAPTHEVAEYLSSATAAIFPFLPVGNHVWAAPNKYFESVQARLPILTSNMEWLEETVTRLGIGEVFEHSNPASLAAATRTLLDNLDHYRARITDELVREHTFEHFEQVVVDTVGGVVTPRVRDGLRPTSLEPHLASIRRDMLTQRASLADSELFAPRPWLRIGCTNTGGQPRAWAGALMRQHPEVIAESVWLEREQAIRFPVDQTITYQQWTSPQFQRALSRKLTDRVTHVLTESGRPVVGARFGKFFHDEQDWLRQQGIKEALVFHGSDIRSPRRHAELEPHSPFRDGGDELTAKLQSQVDALLPHVTAFDGPVFVTTNDLLDHVPGATWLPVVVDTTWWRSDAVPLAGETPVVFHAPTRGSLKGSDVVDEVCERLQAEGLIRYVRGGEQTRQQMHDAMVRSDIVVDQLLLGDYGITAVEGMAAGKVVIGHVADRVRERIGDEVPIVEATVDTFEAVLRDLLNHPERGAEISVASRDYAVRHHDGHHSARVLADFMGL